jgi:FAD/FMN-containing dehydrogenase
MEHPFLLHETRRRPLATKDLAAKTTRRAAQHAVAFAPLPPLPTIPDVEFLTPGTPKYDQYLPSSNLRTTLRPALRALCKTGQSVAAMLDWVRTNGLPFALRSGGHSYEGFSQTVNVVIDTRRIERVALDVDRQSITVGAGASLGTVYKALKGTGFAFAAGSCPTVGVAGHALGGGFGLLGRAYGLTCDNLLSIKMVAADGNMLTADDQENPDLFWVPVEAGEVRLALQQSFRFVCNHYRKFWYSA